MLRESAGRLRSALLSIDTVISASIFVALASTSGLLDDPGLAAGDAGLLVLGLVASFTWPLLLLHFNLYHSLRTQDLAQVAGRLTAATVAATVVLSAAAFLAGTRVAPSFPLLCAATQAAALGSLRVLGFGGLRLLRRKGRNFRQILVIGTGPRADRMRRAVEANPQWGLRILGFVDEEGAPTAPGIPAEKVHKLIDVPALMRDHVIDEVIVACPRSMLAGLAPLVELCGSIGVPFTVLSDLFGDYMPPPRVIRFDSLAALTFAPVHHSRPKLAIKRGIDVVGAATLLVLAAPVLAAAALAIRLDSKGPILFRQTRCGMHGRRFEMLKLRTMVANAEELRASLLELNEMDGPVFKVADDPRMTRVGRLLRRWSLDELPQLWNVLRGEMSLVGPRPPVPHEVAQYETSQRRRLSMHPGLTCLWQVSGRNRIGFDDWVKLDLQYIDTWSLSLDLQILLRTFPAVLRRTGAS